MATEEEEWALKLLVTGAGDAMKMAGALGSLDVAQMSAAQSAAAFNKAQRSAGGAKPADAVMRPGATKAPTDVKAALGSAGDPFKAAAAGADKLIGKKAALKDILGGGLGNIAQAAQQTGGPLGSLAGKIEQVAGVLGRVPPHVAAIIAAVVVMTAAVTVTAAAVYKLFDAATSVIAQRNALLATFGALGGGGAAGGKTLAMVEKLSTTLPFATAQLAEWATGLQKAGLQGRALEQALKGVAAAEALIKGGGAAAESLFRTLALGGANALQLIATLKRGGPEARDQLAQMGLRVEDLAAALGMTVAQFRNARLSAKQMAEAVEKALARKAAGPLGDLMLTWPVLVQRVREGLLSLFDRLGPAVKPFMAAVKKLFDNFAKGGAVINALKPIVTSLMTTLFAWATKAANAIGAIVGWLVKSTKAGGVFSGAIAAIKVVWSVLVKVFGLAVTALKPLIGILVAVFSNAMVLKGIATILTLIVLWIGVAVVAVAAFAAAVGTMVAYVVGVFAALIGAVAGVGGAIVDGLVGGLDIGAFVSKMAEMASAGLAAFKGVLGIASPSKVMLQHGEKNIAGAAATGVEKGADKFDASMSKLGPEGAEGGGKGGKMSASKDGGVHFHDCTFIGHEESWWRDMFEKIMSEMASAAPSPEPQT